MYLDIFIIYGDYYCTICFASKMKHVVFQKSIDPGPLNKMYTRSGYLFLMEKKAVLGTTSWNKCYCHYRRDDGQGGRVFCMIPYNQVK